MIVYLQLLGFPFRSSRFVRRRTFTQTGTVFLYLPVEVGLIVFTGYGSLAVAAGFSGGHGLPLFDPLQRFHNYIDL